MGRGGSGVRQRGFRRAQGGRGVLQNPTSIRDNHSGIRNLVWTDEDRHAVEAGVLKSGVRRRA